MSSSNSLPLYCSWFDTMPRTILITQQCTTTFSLSNSKAWQFALPNSLPLQFSLSNTERHHSSHYPIIQQCAILQFTYPTQCATRVRITQQCHYGYHYLTKCTATVLITDSVPKQLPHTVRYYSSHYPIQCAIIVPIIQLSNSVQYYYSHIQHSALLQFSLWHYPSTVRHYSSHNPIIPTVCNITVHISNTVRYYNSHYPTMPLRLSLSMCMYSQVLWLDSGTFFYCYAPVSGPRPFAMISTLGTIPVPVLYTKSQTQILSIWEVPGEERPEAEEEL
jgi:hypothetical protein